jgi:hypothetical protein
VSEADFNPDDMTELEGIFAEMIADNEDGFIMEFGISRLNAKELIDEWYNAEQGDPEGMYHSWKEYTKIIKKLQAALGMDDY